MNRARVSSTGPSSPQPTLASPSRTVSAPTEIDQLYPKLRPARVTITTSKGKFVRQADEAWGSRQVPLDDELLS